MELDLRNVFPLAPGRTEALDTFIGQRLFEVGIWPSPRTSGGIPCVRAVEYGPGLVRVCGWIYDIDQTLHAFWLDVERSPFGTGAVWTLYFDIAVRSECDARIALEGHDRAEGIDWRVTLTGAFVLRTSPQAAS